MIDLTQKECRQLLSNNYVGHIAFISDGFPDILPITYYYDPTSHSIVSYSGEGSKIEAMRKNGNVSFQVNEITALEKWKSVLIHGIFEELSGTDARYLLHRFAEGVKKTILNKDAISTHSINEFSSKVNTETIPIVYRINISEIKGRQRK